eukprot:2960846-Amphidinium_carterae.1
MFRACSPQSHLTPPLRVNSLSLRLTWKHALWLHDVSEDEKMICRNALAPLICSIEAYCGGARYRVQSRCRGSSVYQYTCCNIPRSLPDFVLHPEWAKLGGVLSEEGMSLSVVRSVRWHCGYVRQMQHKGIAPHFGKWLQLRDSVAKDSHGICAV